MYLVAFRPFVSKTDNNFEIFNECTLMLITYCFMFFLQSLKANEKIGSVFIWVYICNISINGLRLAYNFFFVTLYECFKSLRELWRIKKYERNKEYFFAQNLEQAKSSPEDYLAQARLQESQKIAKDLQFKKLKKSQQESYEKEYQWFKENELDIQYLNGLYPDYIDKKNGEN